MRMNWLCFRLCVSCSSLFCVALTKHTGHVKHVTSCVSVNIFQEWTQHLWVVFGKSVWKLSSVSESSMPVGDKDLQNIDVFNEIVMHILPRYPPGIILIHTVDERLWILFWFVAVVSMQAAITWWSCGTLLVGRKWWGSTAFTPTSSTAPAGTGTDPRFSLPARTRPCECWTHARAPSSL